MTLLELNQFVKSLEARVAELEKKPVHVSTVTLNPDFVALSATPKEQTRKMCPHCGVKPNHFFHVKTCQKRKINGEKETPS